MQYMNIQYKPKCITVNCPRARVFRKHIPMGLPTSWFELHT